MTRAFIALFIGLLVLGGCNKQEELSPEEQKNGPATTQPNGTSNTSQSNGYEYLKGRPESQYF